MEQYHPSRDSSRPGTPEPEGTLFCSWCGQRMRPEQAWIGGDGKLRHRTARECKTPAERARIEAMKRRYNQRRK